MAGLAIADKVMAEIPADYAQSEYGGKDAEVATKFMDDMVSKVSPDVLYAKDPKLAVKDMGGQGKEAEELVAMLYKGIREMQEREHGRGEVPEINVAAFAAKLSKESAGLSR